MEEIDPVLFFKLLSLSILPMERFTYTYFAMDKTGGYKNVFLIEEFSPHLPLYGFH